MANGKSDYSRVDEVTKQLVDMVHLIEKKFQGRFLFKVPSPDNQPLS
jgi:hypothetical protein